jgi:hypothetical protein
LVTSMLSSTVSGGSIPGSLLASMVFPEPGGPLKSMLISNATHPRLRFSATLGKEPKIDLRLA